MLVRGLQNKLKADEIQEMLFVTHLRVFAFHYSVEKWKD